MGGGGRQKWGQRQHPQDVKLAPAEAVVEGDGDIQNKMSFHEDAKALAL